MAAAGCGVRRITLWRVSVGFTLGDATFTGFTLGSKLGKGACVGLAL
jgi:hypothetical protein